MKIGEIYAPVLATAAVLEFVLSKFGRKDDRLTRLVSACFFVLLAILLAVVESR